MATRYKILTTSLPIDIKTYATASLPVADILEGSTAYDSTLNTLTAYDGAAWNPLLKSSGALGTPASGVMTNVTGTAANLTAGYVTTNANLTGDVTSSGNATTIGSAKVTPAMRTGGFKIGTFTCPAGTGNKAVTGVGFVPKMVKFYTTFTSASAAQGTIGMGCMTADGSQWANHVSSRSIPIMFNGFTASKCISFYTITAGSVDTVSVEGVFVSMDADGFTINLTTTNAAYSIQWEAYA